MNQRRYRPVDTAIIEIDRALATLFGRAPAGGRVSPATALFAAEAETDTIDTTATTAETPGPAAAATQNGQDPEPRGAARRESARLMRVNHSGEVCAQALYHGQALVAGAAPVRQALNRAALEEGDHLRWCRERLEQLGSRPSLLDPLFYAGSWALGVGAGLAGDRWSLGFLAETERQVERHLDGHLRRLPEHDRRSRAVLEQMRRDEAEHAAMAQRAGAAELPRPLRLMMTAASRLMTRTSYWL